MVLLAILCLGAGVLFGYSGFAEAAAVFLTKHSDYVLYALMLSVGIGVGMNRSVFSSIRQHHIKIFIIPFAIIAASVAGGAAGAALLGLPLSHGMIVSSGLGWYSLSGVLVTDLLGAQLGTVSFLSNLMREIFSCCIIPFLARRLNFYTTIAPAAATSEDTTLALIARYTNEEVVVLALFNGVLCSAAAPVLIRFFAGL